jgi:hypothetical protein
LRFDSRAKNKELTAGQGDPISLDDATVATGKRFCSQQRHVSEYEASLARTGLCLRRLDNNRSALFSRNIAGAPVFIIQGGANFKGQYVDGVGHTGCTALPGDRYLILPVWNDSEKQLLIDGMTGQYRELPAESRAYVNVN